MGRTIPSFRLALEMEEREWKPFRNALDKSDRKKFDEMFDVPRLYTSACSYAVQPVRLYPILMSILLHCYKQLVDCISQVRQMMVVVGIEEEEEEKEEEALPLP
ncbi:MAG: hypothetical protein M3136_10570 [Thermoproteota archaeon]|nr:hypothetical protein [Thermoproteota archaeon]